MLVYDWAAGRLPRPLTGCKLLFPLFREDFRLECNDGYAYEGLKKSKCDLYAAVLSVMFSYVVLEFFLLSSLPKKDALGGLKALYN